jgi:ATP-binding cassette subfamily B protein
MAERAHAIHTLRSLSATVGALVQAVCLVIATVAAMIWIDPASAPVAIAAGTVSVLLPLLSQRLMAERDLRVRTQTGAQTRFFLDALLGLTALRAHSAEKAVKREHESLLVEWLGSSFDLLRAAVQVQGIVALSGYLAAIWVLADHLNRFGESGMALLLVYWALSLPALGGSIALAARGIPPLRNTALRLLEPLGAPEDSREADHEPVGDADPAAPIAITFDNVSVQAGGHTILHGIDLEIEPGSHVAVVGPSGAGKSTLIGVLLGWHQPSRGSVLVDRTELTGGSVEHLRRRTAWIDPEVQLWNRSLFDNLYYGCSESHSTAAGETLEQAGLFDLVERLPMGLQTALGEGGRLLSGGEGQRVRLGRACNRRGVGLALLDEPFRGLDREQRRVLLARVRRRFRACTLICATHDIRETAGFDRVLVVENGRITETGSPERLREESSGAYRRLVDEDERVGTTWRSRQWRRLHVSDGLVTEIGSGDES